MKIKIGDLVVPKSHRWHEGMVEVTMVWGDAIKVKYHGQRTRKIEWFYADDVTPDTARTREKKLDELGI